MKTFLTVILSLVCAFTFAQKKPKINKARSAMENGELVEAKTIIDQAIDHDKTKDDPKTWFYRGMIYAVLDTAMNEPGALEVAIDAYNKSLEIDPEQKSTTSFSGTGIENVDTKLNEYYSYYYNKGIENYTSENFKASADFFENAFEIMPADTSAMLNAAYAAGAAGEMERSKLNFMKALEAGSIDKNIFLQLYNYNVKEENYEEALNIIRKGKENYPNDMNLSKYEISVLIQLKQTEEAKTEIEKAILNEPNNPDLNFNLGVLKEETGDIEGAIESYKNAIAIEPDHYNSNFNLGVSIFNRSNEMIKERNALGYKETKKYDELSKKINTQLKTALPIWEKLYSLNSTERTVLETLSYIYTNLGMKDKANKMEDELESMN